MKDLRSGSLASQLKMVKHFFASKAITHTGGGGSDKFGYKNAIKHEKGGPRRFSDSSQYPLKRIWPKPQGPLILDL
jgi:hypothetical protein